MEPHVKVPRLQYDRANLQRAFAATQAGMSVYRAARQYKVPESTLRDRTRGNIAIDATLGHGTLLSSSEEKELVDHIIYMSQIGYGYTKSEIQYMGREYALSLGKPVQSREILSKCWFYDFLKRHLEIKCVKPQKRAISRAKSASKEKLGAYFKELGTILTTNNLHEHPENIFNIDETGVSTEHSPSKIVCSKESIAQSVTSPRSSNVTIIAAGSAIGNNIPPYYVFPGKRWNADLLNGALPGSSGEMTSNGWSNSTVFTNYLTKHFPKYVNLSEGKNGHKVLILYDGHKSHSLLTLTKWAQRKNVILFVLPPHTSHLTQPLDVGIFGPFKSMYSHECHAYMRRNPGICVSKYNIAELTAKPYIRALRPENLVAAFGKAGVYPFDGNVITPAHTAPAVIYETPQEPVDSSDMADQSSQETTPYGRNSQTPTADQSLKGQCSSITDEENKPLSDSKQFFQQRTITSVVPVKRKRKFVPPYLSGSLMKKKNLEILESAAAKKSSLEQQSEIKKSKVIQKVNKTFKKPEKSKSAGCSVETHVKPSTSGNNKAIYEHVELLDSDSETDTVKDDDLCCVCHAWQPEALRGCTSVCFVKWGKCDFCSHWTHLKYCCNVSVLRRASVFRCPHCLTLEE